jgi:hypothetical protein
LRQKSFGTQCPFHWFRDNQEPTIEQMDNYLQQVWDYGKDWHDQFYQNEFTGASRCKFPFVEETICIVEVENEIVKLCNNALNTENDYTPHTKVEKHFIEYDVNTIAVEVPVFINDWSMYGHIDIVRFKDNKFEVWDYKNHLNGNVKSQLYCYMFMLSVRTQLPMTMFKAGYFTKDYAMELIM